MDEIIRRIMINGITSDYSDELIHHIRISNIFNVIFIFLVFPFIFIFRESSLASLIASMPILFHVISFILIKYHRHKAGRFIFSIATPTSVYFAAALIYIDDGTDGMAAKFLILGTIILPFIVFMKNEWKYTLVVLILNFSYLISFNHINDLLVLENLHNVDGPELRFISLITTFVMFSSIFFYYKKQISEINIKLDQSNNHLVERNRELKALNATKNKFFTIIAHDLKSPFNTILGFTEMLQKKHKTINDKELEFYSKTIYKASLNTYKIVENLLTWSHSQLNKVTRKPITINVKNFVSDIIAQLHEIANLKEINVEICVDQSICANADRNIANVVLQNLLSNAIKFSYRDSTIKLSAYQIQFNNKAYIEICVADSGVGMSLDTISKLFKIENTQSLEGTEDEQGTGLGLFLCKEFTENNGGKIRVESKLGKGSEVYFTLPADISQMYDSNSLTSTEKSLRMA
jgi:signal transduction histidine kinase